MTEKPEHPATPPQVVPLRSFGPDGEPYKRPTEIEELLAALVQLPMQELGVRVRIEDPLHSDYVPSECILYFLRMPSIGSNQDLFRDLFRVIRQRVIRATHVRERPIPGTSKRAESIVDLEIQEKVMQQFQERLCLDRRGYDRRLDLFECKFNFAVARLRATARRDVRKEAARYVPIDLESNLSEPSAEVEAALAATRTPCDGSDSDFLYRLKILRAISSLPPDERRVIELLIQGVQIDSDDEHVETIRKIIGCSSEKTVRNLRDRARVRLSKALKDEEET